MSKQSASAASITLFARRKKKGEKIVMLTAYDALFARLQDGGEVDAILVGDSVGMVQGGLPTTIPVTLDEMVYHTRMVSRGLSHSLLIADMPFLSAQVSTEEALRNAGRLLAEGGAAAVKIEGGQAVSRTIARLVDVGIPVMGHLGVIPQSIHSLGGYRTRGTRRTEADRLLEDALALQEAGCFSIVLEKVKPELAARITRELRIPTIGIGSGADCDGQVLVNADMLGLFEDFQPRFVRRFAELGQAVRQAVSDYAAAVRSGDFPSADEQ